MNIENVSGNMADDSPEYRKALEKFVEESNKVTGESNTYEEFAKYNPLALMNGCKGNCDGYMVDSVTYGSYSLRLPITINQYAQSATDNFKDDDDNNIYYMLNFKKNGKWVDKADYVYKGSDYNDDDLEQIDSYIQEYKEKYNYMFELILVKDSGNIQKRSEYDTDYKEYDYNNIPFEYAPSNEPPQTYHIVAIKN